MFFLNKNKKKKRLVFLLAFFIFSGAIFAFTDVRVVSAGGKGCIAGAALGSLKGGAIGTIIPGAGTAGGALIGAAGGCVAGSLAGDAFGGTVEYGFKTLLYGILTVVGVLTSIAIVIFEWAVKPEHISGPSGLLNLPAIYAMWQFIRDFLNLFFILVLLYIAFTVVFQVQKNFKQLLLSLIIAALLVNFSFPISRALIDATNVPMYFFANTMMTSTNTKTAGAALGPTLSASKLRAALVPKDLDTTEIPQLLVAIIFTFLFSITLLVLAVMFVIRMAVLMILVVFSSVAFVASIVPGLDKYSKMWWENFWKYALFGPAAMFMLLIAIRFLSIIGNEGSATFKDIEEVAGNISSNPTYLASLAMFSVPIILLWMTIGLGQKFAIAGGATISGYGHKFAAWAGKTVTKTPAMWTGRKYEKWATTREGKLGQVTKWLAPSVLKQAYEGWSKDNKESDKSSLATAAADVQDVFNKKISRRKTHEGFRIRQQQDNKRAKELLDISKNSEYLVNELDAAYDDGVREDINGSILALAQTNNPNDLLSGAVGKEYGKGLELTPEYEYIDKKTGEKKKTRSAIVSSNNYRILMNNLLERAGYKKGTKEMAMARMSIGEVAHAAGNGALFAQGGFKDGEWRDFTPEEQADVVKSKALNMSPRDRERLTHPDTIFKYHYDPNGDRHIDDVNDEVGIAALSVIDNGDIKSVGTYGRDDKKTGFMDIEKVRDGDNMPEQYKKALAKNKMLQGYIDEIEDSRKLSSDGKSGSKSDGKSKADFATLAARSKQS